MGSVVDFITPSTVRKKAYLRMNGESATSSACRTTGEATGSRIIWTASSSDELHICSYAAKCYSLGGDRLPRGWSDPWMNPIDLRRRILDRSTVQSAPSVSDEYFEAPIPW